MLLTLSSKYESIEEWARVLPLYQDHWGQHEFRINLGASWATNNLNRFMRQYAANELLEVYLYDYKESEHLYFTYCLLIPSAKIPCIIGPASLLLQTSFNFERSKRMFKLAERDGRKGITLDLKVSPGAKVEEFQGVHGDRLKVKVAAKAVEGAANTALLKFIAASFSVPLASV